MIKDRPDLKNFVKPSDFNSDDKMNVDAGKRLCQKEIIDVIGDPGLKLLLSLLKDFIAAFEEPDMSIKEKLVKVSTNKFIIFFIVIDLFFYVSFSRGPSILFFGHGDMIYYKILSEK